MFVFINTNKHHFPSCVLLEEYLCRGGKKTQQNKTPTTWTWVVVWECVSAPHTCALVSAEPVAPELGAGSGAGPGFGLVAAERTKHRHSGPSFIDVHL